MLVGYMRISTAGDQVFDLQRDALLKAGVHEISLFWDIASGARTRRKELERCLSVLKAGDVLVVWKLDRLARSLSHLLTLLGDFQARGIGFRSLTEEIDTTTAQGKLIFHVRAVFAEFERDLISERVKAGLTSAAERGRKGGRPRSLKAEQIAYAIEELAGNRTTKTALAKLFKVNRSTVIAELKTADLFSRKAN